MFLGFPHVHPVFALAAVTLAAVAMAFDLDDVFRVASALVVAVTIILVLAGGLDD